MDFLMSLHLTITYNYNESWAIPNSHAIYSQQLLLQYIPSNTITLFLTRSPTPLFIFRKCLLWDGYTIIDFGETLWSYTITMPASRRLIVGIHWMKLRLTKQDLLYLVDDGTWIYVFHSKKTIIFHPKANNFNS